MPQPRVLSATFVRTVGERDRIYVTRADGSAVSWTMTTYGEALPHDLVHLVVESAFGLAQGFWGRVNGGADPGAISREANRTGGRDKYAAYGPDQTELLLAESLANVRWLDEGAADSLLAHVQGGYREAGLASPSTATPERVERLRAVLRGLTRRWRGLRPKGALAVEFDPADPARGFERLSRDPEA
jgi:hypothetical protein